MSKTTFKDVWTGLVFGFTSATNWSGIAQGPWLKTGDRTYVRYDIGPNAFYGEHKVGSVSAEVTDIRPPKDYFWISYDKKGNVLHRGHGYKPFARDLSSGDPLLTSGILGDVVQMFSGSAPGVHKFMVVNPHFYGTKDWPAFVTIYARGAERYKDMADIGIPLGTYQVGDKGKHSHWRKKIFSPPHALK
jgi:hypothetical protein